MPGPTSSSAAQIAATVSPQIRVVAPASRTRTERLIEVQLTYSAERRSHDVGEAEHFEVTVDVGLCSGGDLDAGGIEQQGDAGDENDGDCVAGKRRHRRPGEITELLKLPRQGQMSGRLRLKEPAGGLRLRER